MLSRYCMIIFILIFYTINGIAIDQSSHLPDNTFSENGMVSSAHPLASQTGIEILKKGGNAVDAAVATAFVLNVVEPHASGIGGGGFMMIRLADRREVVILDFREYAPQSSENNMFVSEIAIREGWSQEGGMSVAIPGTLMGLHTALKEYGTMGLPEVMGPAIRYMEEGIIVSDYLSKIIEDNLPKLVKWNDPNQVPFLDDGLPLYPGEILFQPELAHTFQEIADQGIRYFYEGELAKKIIATIQKKGGIMTEQDLRNYKISKRIPLIGNYQGNKIYAMPYPSTGGVHLIQLLNILEYFNLEKIPYHSLTHISILSEAIKITFYERLKSLPFYFLHQGESYLSHFLTKDYAKNLAIQIDVMKPNNLFPEQEYDKTGHHSTTHISVVDSLGNAVSLTQTINYFFGSGIIVPETGIILNNEMDDFSSNPESANAPGPVKIPLSYMSPTIIEKENELLLVLGTPGGNRIFTTIAQIISNIIDYKMTIDEAIESSRIHTYVLNGEAVPIYYENRIPEITIKALEIIGHDLVERGSYDLYFGGAHGILVRDGLLYGGADSRREGIALGY